MIIFIVLGTREGVHQDGIGGPFVAHPVKEIVCAFCDNYSAERFIKSQRLKKPKKERYGDTSYFEGGFMEMEVESCEIIDFTPSRISD